MLALMMVAVLAAPQDTLPPPGTITGVVTDQSSRPIQRAVVQVLPTQKEVLTSSSGDFRFTGREPGLHVVIVSALGYRRHMMQVELSPTAGWRGRITLALTVHELPEVVATVNSWKPAEYAGTSRYDGFFMRKRLGFGTFVSRDDIERLAPIHFTQILQRIPGFRVNYTPPGTTQPPTSVKITRCNTDNPPKVAIYIDGRRTRASINELALGRGTLRTQEDFANLLDSIHPRDIEMMEVYAGIAQIPADFDRDVCAVIAVWTRWNRT